MIVKYCPARAFISGSIDCCDDVIHTSDIRDMVRHRFQCCAWNGNLRSDGRLHSIGIQKRGLPTSSSFISEIELQMLINEAES